MVSSIERAPNLVALVSRAAMSIPMILSLLTVVAA